MTVLRVFDRGTPVTTRFCSELYTRYLSRLRKSVPTSMPNGPSNKTRRESGFRSESSNAALPPKEGLSNVTVPLPSSVVNLFARSLTRESNLVASTVVVSRAISGRCDAQEEMRIRTGEVITRSNPHVHFIFDHEKSYPSGFDCSRRASEPGSIAPLRDLYRSSYNRHRRDVHKPLRSPRLSRSPS